MKYDYQKKPKVTLTQNTNQALDSILKSDFSVLCGRNNCGKSFLLKTLVEKIGETASYLGPQRYQNFNTLTPFAPRPTQRSKKFQDWLRQWREATQNLDNSPLNLQQAIAELPDKKRDQLQEIMENLLGSKMEILHTIPDNTMSQKYVAVDGHNLSYTSSGYRLLASLVSSLLSEEYDSYLIDEPELGISPEAQCAFADFLFDQKLRNKYFPHVKRIILATHSTVFLDRINIGKNYFVHRDNSNVDVTQVKSVADVNKIHFFLLGNRLESLYMPSAIVVVEGKTDHQYIEKVLNVRYENVQFSIVAANTDNRIREIFHLTKSLFGDLQKSPYQGRMFAILDSVHGVGLVQQLVSMGMPKENIIVWKENGIEFNYPREIMKSIFHTDEKIKISGDVISAGGLEYTKNDLCKKVVDKLSSATKYPEEFENEFLFKLEQAIGHDIT